MLRKIKKFLKEKLKEIPFQEERGIEPLTLGIIAVAALGIGLLAALSVPGATHIANAVLGALMTVVNSIGQGFLDFAANFFYLAVYVGGQVNVSEIEAAAQGAYEMVQSVAYMIIALGFVICGIATALRIAEYEAKRILIPLILVAALISASKPLFYDIWGVTNEITNKFLAAAPMTMNPKISNIAVWYGLVGKNTIEFLVKGGACIFMNFFTGSVYFIYGLIFLMRWAAIPILITFSPFALACIPIGFLRPVWEKWLNQFTGWCLFGMLGAMAVYMANVFMQGDPGGIGAAIEGGDPILAPFRYILPLGCLLVGLLLSGGGSLVGASAISSGIAAAGAGIASVAAGGMAKIAGAATGGAAGGAAGAGAGAGAVALGIAATIGKGILKGGEAALKVTPDVIKNAGSVMKAATEKVSGIGG